MLGHQVQTDNNSGIVVVAVEEDMLHPPVLLVMVEQVQLLTLQLVDGLAADQVDLMEQEQQEVELVDQLVQVVEVEDLSRPVLLFQGQVVVVVLVS